jgi:hypothetical protein
MTETGEMSQIFPVNTQRLQVFMNLFDLPTVLSYTCGSDGEIDLAVWVDPSNHSDHSVYFGVWVHPSKRYSLRYVRILDTIYRATFELKEVICGMTKQPRILDLHRKMGYTVFGPIPRMFDADDGYFVYCTRQSYMQSKFHRIATRSIK